ncbi:MAG: hypothetical protein F6K30_27420 [Cyanothece sp. SIO2G6]|nr:hypothetical protein [Cyanothece sp. SIO2G6]
MSNRFTNHHHGRTPPHRPSAFSSAAKTFSPRSASQQATSGSADSAANAWINQVKLSLAVMESEQLRVLLLQTDPSPIADKRLGQVSLRLEMPLGSRATADGILRFEVISCRLANPDTVPPSQPMASRFQRHRAMVNQIRCETKLHNLGLNLTLTDAIARLQCALFASSDIQRILQLPYHGWHRSWWEMVDPNHEFSLPFQRLMRSRRYADGTVTLQYKDQFAYLPPPCFRSHSETALLHIQRPDTPFATTLAEINQGREALGLNHAVLIYRHLSKSEYQAFRHQGVRLYHWQSEHWQSEHWQSEHWQSEHWQSEHWQGDRVTPSHQHAQKPCSITVLPTVLPTQTSPTQASPTQASSTQASSTQVSSTQASRVDCQRCSQVHCAMQGNPNSPVTNCRQFKTVPPTSSDGTANGVTEPPSTPGPAD